MAVYFFFFNDPATTEIYTLSLHDALPISRRRRPSRTREPHPGTAPGKHRPVPWSPPARDRKSTRLNSSHSSISYAVFCLKKKKKKKNKHTNKKKKTKKKQIKKNNRKK